MGIKTLKKVLCILLSMVLLLGIMPPISLDTASAASSGIVRVRIATASDVTRVVVYSRGNYSVGGNSSRPFMSGQSATVYVEGGELHITIDGTTYDMGTSFKLVRHAPDKITNALSFTTPSLSKYFPGDMEFRLVSGSIQTVNHVFIEDYLCGVLDAEWSQSHTFESQKAMAIVARTKTRGCMAKPKGSYYDIRNTSADQNYKGVNVSATTTARAVSETEGIVIRYNGSLVDGTYGATNGGQIETSKNWWSGSAVAYSSVKDDPYDYANPNSKVNKLTVYSDFDGNLSKTGMSALNKLLLAKVADELDSSIYSTDTDDITILTVNNVYPHTPKYPEPSRVYTKMRFNLFVSAKRIDSDTQEQVSGTIDVDLDIFSQLDTSTFGLSIQSAHNELFSVEESNGNFIIEARRWGHGVGYSQYGGDQMAREGFGWRGILDFYYNAVVTYPSEKFTRPTLTALDGSSYDVEPTVTPKPTALPDCELFDTPLKATANVSSSLNMRVEPMSGANVVTTIKRGETLAAIGVIGEWTFVEYNEQMGYVMTKYLTMTSEPIATSVPDVTYAPTASPAPTATAIIVPDDSKYMQVMCTTYANLRSGPGTSYSSLAHLTNGTLVKLLGVSGTWSHIMYGSVEGYVSSSLLTAANTATATPAVTATPTAAPTSTAAAERSAVVKCSSTLNVRKTASTSGTKLGTLKNGAAITVLSVSNGWACIKYGTGTAYVNASYITYTDSPTATPAATVTVAPTATATAAAERSAVVKCSSTLNVRKTASTSGTKLGTLKNGAAITVLSVSNGWACIKYGTGTAYVNVSYITYTDSPTTVPTATAAPTAVTVRVATVNCSQLNMRASASTSAAKLATLKRGASVNVISESNGWARILYNGKEGYVSAQYLKYESATQAPTNAPTPTATTAPTAQPTTDSGVNGFATITNCSTMNLRQLPTTESSSLGVFKKGTEVYVRSTGNGVDGEWACIVCDGKTGYMKEKYLSFKDETSSSQTQAPTTAPTATAAPTAAPTETPAANSAYVAGVTDRGTVTASTLNMRKSASTSASIVYILKKNDDVEIVGATADLEWLYVKYGNYEGYCSIDYIQPYKSQDSLIPQEEIPLPTPQTAV